MPTEFETARTEFATAPALALDIRLRLVVLYHCSGGGELMVLNNADVGPRFGDRQFSQGALGVFVEHSGLDTSTIEQLLDQMGFW